MAQMEGRSSDDDTIGIKRDRVDSDDSSADSLDSKRVRLDSEIQAPDSPVPEPRVLDESNSENIVREDFLDMLEEELDIEPEIQGLESVIRSLEREINLPAPAPEDLMDETLVLSEPDQIELGYLLEASDDELGLPPTASIGDGAAGSGIETSPINSQTANLTGVLASEDEMSRFNDSFGHEIAGGENHAGDLLTMDGLFEYGGYVDASDVPELQCWPESMPAL